MSEEWNIEFTVTGPLDIEESLVDRAVLNGVFLKLDSVSKNGNEYQVEEGEQIASWLQGMPVFYGTTAVFNPETGMLELNRHAKGVPFTVGRVIKTIFDKMNKIVKGSIEVWNTKDFPDLVSRIKKGWGFSIGGKAAEKVSTGLVNEIGKEIKKIFGMKPNHLQLLEPTTPRGQDDAKVDDIIPVEESLSFTPCPWGACTLDENNITRIPVETQEDIAKTIIRKTFYTTDPDSKLKYIV